MRAKQKSHLIFIGFIAWLLPFVAGYFMVDKQTGEFLPNIVVFALTTSVVFLLTVLICLLFYRRRYPQFLWFRTGSIIVLVCVALDLLILVLLFKMPFVNWVTRAFPVYLIVTYGIVGLLRTTTKTK